MISSLPACSGVSVVSAGNTLRWPASLHGICGDPYNGVRKHEYGGVSANGTITATYKEGQVINIQIVITTWHYGRYRFRICVIETPTKEKTLLTDDCLDEHLLVRLAAVLLRGGRGGGVLALCGFGPWNQGRNPLSHPPCSA